MTTYAAWRYIPSTFVQCKKDQTPIAGMADMMINGAQQIEPTAVDVVERCDAGHFPMLSQPGWTAEAIMRAAGEKA